MHPLPLLLIGGMVRATPAEDCATRAAEAPAIIARLEAGDESSIQEGLTAANALERCQSGAARPLEAALRAAAQRQAAARVADGRFSEATDLLAPLVGRLDLGEDLRAVERAWGSEARAAALADEAAGRIASALVRASLAASLSREPADAELRERLRQTFLDRGTIALDLAVTGPAGSRQRLEEILPAAL